MVAQPGDGVRPRRVHPDFSRSHFARFAFSRAAHRYVSLIMNQARRILPPSPRPAARLTRRARLAGRVASVHS